MDDIIPELALSNGNLPPSPSPLTDAVTRYSKAPVSEVICGVTFAEARLSLEDLFGARQVLSGEYPKIEIRPPLADEAMSGFQLTQELNPDSAPVLIRLRSNDDDWMCQVQANKVYLNWIRPDHKPVGNYPGYTAVYRRFGDVLDALGISTAEFSRDSVKYYDLSYHDRLEWQDHIASLSEAHEIMRIKPPAITTPEGFNNLFSRYTYRCQPLGGYGVFSVNTATTATGKQVLILESTLRGITPDHSSDDWFGEAHRVQVSHFSQLFRPEILAQWE